MTDSVIGSMGGIKIMTLSEAQTHLLAAVAADKAADARYIAALTECREAKKAAEVCARELEGCRQALVIAALRPDDPRLIDALVGSLSPIPK